MMKATQEAGASHRIHSLGELPSHFFVPGAVDEEGRMPFYAEECASMLAVTFSGGDKMLRSIVSALGALLTRFPCGIYEVGGGWFKTRAHSVAEAGSELIIRFKLVLNLQSIFLPWPPMC